MHISKPLLAVTTKCYKTLMLISKQGLARCWHTHIFTDCTYS